MQVEKREQTPSAPFWMGCERNIKEYEIVKKEPYTDLASSSNVFKSNLSYTVLLIVTIFYIQSLIT